MTAIVRSYCAVVPPGTSSVISTDISALRPVCRSDSQYSFDLGRMRNDRRCAATDAVNALEKTTLHQLGNGVFLPVVT